MGNVKWKVLVLGMGNLLMADDGLGVYAAGCLQEKEWPREAMILEAGTSVLNYLGEISKAGIIIAVDAVRGGGEPGTVYRLEAPNSLPPAGARQDAHGFSLLQVVALAREMTGLPRQLIIYGIEPLDLGPGNRLSPPVREAIPGLLGRVEGEIKSWLYS